MAKIRRYRALLLNPNVDPFWDKGGVPAEVDPVNPLADNDSLHHSDVEQQDHSPDICSEQRLPPTPRQRKPYEVYSPRKGTRQPSTRRHKNSSDLNLNQEHNLQDNYLSDSPTDNNLPSHSKHLMPSDGDSLEEFSPRYDEDTEPEDVDIDPFVPDMFFNPDTSLMDAFGSLLVPDPFISSSEPMGEVMGNDGLNTPLHRSPSPGITPVMSPETPNTPETPVMLPYSEVELPKQITTRSLRNLRPNSKINVVNTKNKVNKRSPQVTPKKTSKTQQTYNQGKKMKIDPKRKVKTIEDSSSEEGRTLRPRQMTNGSSSLVKQSIPLPQTPLKSSIVPYDEFIQINAGLNNYDTALPTTQRFPSIKPDVSTASNELEKSFKEKIIDFVGHYESYERPGKLVRLKLENFMCHDSLKEEWHRMVNYIIADNGAGKSAILVALQLVFGAKASTTMRCTSVKELIKHDRDFSAIEVTLTNDGILDISKYGKEIGIIRTVLLNGTSRYQIRTADGKGKRSLSRKELERIKATLQIMVDNPAMILNQEASRNFLRTTDPQALYNYFYRGLNLEHCEVLLIRSEDDIEAARIALGTKHKLLDELQSKAREFKADYDVVLSLSHGSERAQDLNREYYWAIVSRVEEELSGLEDQLSTIVEKCVELERQLEDITVQQNSLDTNQESSQSQLKRLKKVLHSKREGLEVKSRESHTYRQEIGAAKAKLINISRLIKEKTNRVHSIEAEIARIREESDRRYHQCLRQIEEQRRSLQTRKETARKLLNEAKGSKEESYTTYDRSKQTHIEWLAKSEDIQFRIREKRHELVNIQKKQNFKYNRYGSEMVKLMAEIEKLVKNRQFKEAPTGPQSACYTVKEEFREYAPLIEHILGSTLFQIRVGHVQDKILLQGLMKKIYGKKPQPDILYHPMKNKERYNLLNVKKNSGYNTVLDALDIADDDPVVVNWLADSNGIEKILLFRTEEEACNIMKEARRVPRGCSIAYSLNFKRIHADPHHRSIVINPVKTKTSFIQITSRLGNDELVKNEIRELEVEASEILGMLETAKKEAKYAKDLDREVDRNLKAAQAEVNNIETSLQGLDETISQGPDLASYVEDEEELRDSISQNIGDTETLETVIKELHPKYDAAERHKKQLEEIILSTENEIQTIENQGDFAKRANDLRIKFKNLNEDLTNQKTTKQSLTKKVKDVTSSLEKNIKLATSKGKRVRTKKEPSTIKEELRCLDQLLHKNRHKINRKEKLKEDWERAQHVADTVEKDIRVAGKLIGTLIPTITSQFRRFNKKKNDFGNTLQSCFQSLVSSKKFGGRLFIDHEERNLMFWVCPDANSEERAKAYIKDLENCMLYKKGMRDYISSLSGGERSFSTICFMVSMWKTMEAPFYILDEFDVFMDTANQKASQRILNAHTRNQPEAQFIFITPLKLNAIVYPQNSKVLRLYPPIRDSKQAAVDEAAHKSRHLKVTEEKQKGPAKKRAHFEDGDYFDYLYKAIPNTAQAVPIMC